MIEETDDIFDAAMPTANPLLAPFRADVLFLGEETPPEQMLLVLGQCKNYIAELKNLQKMVEAAMMLSIDAHGPIIVSDTVQYVIGSDKTTKCKDVPAAVEALMGAVDGDFARFCGTLSTNAIKHGAAKKILSSEQFDNLFETVVKKTLEEKPVKKLLRLDAAFVK